MIWAAEEKVKRSAHVVVNARFRSTERYEHTWYQHQDLNHLFDDLIERGGAGVHAATHVVGRLKAGNITELLLPTDPFKSDWSYAMRLCQCRRPQAAHGMSRLVGSWR